MKTVFVYIGAFLLVFVILFFTGAMGNLYKATIGRQAQDIRRENFEHNKSYVHGKILDLAKYKREYQRAVTKEEKEQIRNFILNEFANFDKNLIDNRDLYNFLMEMERGVK